MNDYHIHSTFSPDANQTIEEICDRAVNLGLKEIAITDHVDKDCPVGSDWDIDYDEYADEIIKVKNKYKSSLKVLLGVELGVQTNIISKLKEYTKKHEFDFIIASVHHACECDISCDSFHCGKSQYESYVAYLNDLLYIVRNFEEYNVIGHLDLIVRYGNYSDKRLYLKKYGDIIDSILNTVIEKQRGIEINTSGYRYGLGSFHPNVDVIKRYKELGGEIITVGSDAHKLDQVGYKLKETYNILKDLGFKYITTYKNLKPEFKKI